MRGRTITVQQQQRPAETTTCGHVCVQCLVAKAVRSEMQEGIGELSEVIQSKVLARMTGAFSAFAGGGSAFDHTVNNAGEHHRLAATTEIDNPTPRKTWTGRRRRLSDEDRQEILALKKDGMNIQAIAAKYGVAWVTIRDTIKKLNANA
jgi:hypothetical protein